ncbi:50S ribosomal protein L18 [Candidatus Woesearchaeota archaeon CG10_big_fil_rev_8_21_14_0_10_45_16]|nr:MAG: 50S ribosomal protein L18 [Candidatus Woesearchaeota archaeon CG10_big_fil_rev_8_21_14_0_10_45_16]
MASRKPKTVIYRRRREQRTNYKKRLHLLLSGKPRLIIRFTNQRIIAQLAAFTPQGDKVLVGVDSSALKKLGWNYSCKNFPAAYLTGYMLGKKALKASHKEAILDAGIKTPQKKGKAYAFLKGVLDAGVVVPHGDEDMFPDAARMSGAHIAAYAKILAANQEAYTRRFAEYLKNKAKPEDVVKSFEETKKKIQG